MVRITPLFYAIPVLSQFIPSESTLNGLVARQSIDPSSLPSACQSSCQVLDTLSSCGETFFCVCNNTTGNQLQQCMNCLVSSDPAVQSEAQSFISSWNEACNGTLSLSGSSSSGGTTGGSTGGTTGGATSGPTGSTTTGSTGSTPATTTGTSSSGGSSSKPLGVTSGTVGLKTGGSMVVCIVAAFAGAFMSL